MNVGGLIGISIFRNVFVCVTIWVKGRLGAAKLLDWGGSGSNLESAERLNSGADLGASNIVIAVEGPTNSTPKTTKTAGKETHEGNKHAQLQAQICTTSSKFD